jgi:DNA-binding helix-hairpin-helix protein with protein kinase domain
MLMARYYDPQGRPVTLGKELGSGGDGAVYEIAGDPRRVAKIYHHPVAASKAEKLRSMAELASIDLTTFASWPLEVLTQGGSDRVLGIVLPRINDHGEIHKLYSPAHRKIDYPDKDWSFLAHVAMNCAAAFDAIHAKSHVIGDVNQGNVLVSRRGTVFLIDSDSFQVSARGRKYLCDVGVPQFTPPELQGRNFRGLERTANHDGFGLALLIFHLLVMGRHPFAGRYLGRGDMPIERAIAEFRYAFSGTAARLEMAAPPHTLPLERLAPRLAPLFERAFSRGSERPDARPSAADWHAALSAELAELASCDVDRGHRFPTAVRNCPWCELMFAGAPNFFLSVTFRLATPAVLEVAPAQAALWAEITSVPAPRATPLPPPPAAVSRISPTPAPPAIESARSLTMMVKVVALASLLAMCGMLVWRESGYVTVPLFGVFAAWWLVLFLTSGDRPERNRRRRMQRARRGQLRQLQAAWQARISQADTQYRRLQKELNAARNQIAKLKGQHDGELRKAQGSIGQRQEAEFLQSKFISDCNADSVTLGRKAILASYGLETAFDVEYNRVLGIPGMDPHVTNVLCAWRSEMLRQFKPDKSRGIPAAERQAILLKYAQARQQLDVKLRRGLRELQALDANLQTSLAGLARQIDSAQIAMAQADADLAVMEEMRGSIAKYLWRKRRLR